MNVAQILSKAETMGVRLRIDGELVKLRGPSDAIAALKPEVAAHKPEIMAYLRAASNDSAPQPDDCAGALRDPDGGLYLPWGPYLGPDDVRRLRADLCALIECIAAREGWSRDHADDVLARAMRGPLTDLLPNLSHFNERIVTANAEQEARDALKARTWRMEGFDDRQLK
ncbi:TubC N-terminal docking domain-related protein [Paraburkholderia dipogonis]|uniref:TubC N-terminal docking domain-related protein n=1 Tax=Paraburkholderia dipogonis TaxID=1211383 RepID=UPI0038B982F4